MGRACLTYDIVDVSKSEVAKMVDQLEKDGVISKMEVAEKELFSPEMFLRKIES